MRWYFPQRFCAQFAYHHLDNIIIVHIVACVYNISSTFIHDHLARARGTLMDLLPRGRIQHMLTHRRQHPLYVHSFDIPSFNYDIFSFLFTFFFFLSFYVYHHLSLAHVGPDNIICYSARLGCTYIYICIYTYVAHTVSSLEDFFPERRKNPKINWFCLHYSSPCAGKKKVRVVHTHTRAARTPPVLAWLHKHQNIVFYRVHIFIVIIITVPAHGRREIMPNHFAIQRHNVSIRIRAYIIITYTPCRRLFRRRTHGASKHTTYCNIIINEYTTYTYLFCIHVYAVPW